MAETPFNNRVQLFIDQFGPLGVDVPGASLTRTPSGWALRRGDHPQSIQRC